MVENQDPFSTDWSKGGPSGSASFVNDNPQTTDPFAVDWSADSTTTPDVPSNAPTVDDSPFSKDWSTPDDVNASIGEPTQPPKDIETATKEYRQQFSDISYTSEEKEVLNKQYPDFPGEQKIAIPRTKGKWADAPRTDKTADFVNWFTGNKPPLVKFEGAKAILPGIAPWLLGVAGRLKAQGFIAGSGAASAGGGPQSGNSEYIRNFKASAGEAAMEDLTALAFHGIVKNVIPRIYEDIPVTGWGKAWGLGNESAKAFAKANTELQILEGKIKPTQTVINGKVVMSQAPKALSRVDKARMLRLKRDIKNWPAISELPEQPPLNYNELPSQHIDISELAPRPWKPVKITDTDWGVIAAPLFKRGSQIKYAATVAVKKFRTASPTQRLDKVIQPSVKRAVLKSLERHAYNLEQQNHPISESYVKWSLLVKKNPKISELPSEVKSIVAGEIKKRYTQVFARTVRSKFPNLNAPMADPVGREGWNAVAGNLMISTRPKRFTVRLRSRVNKMASEHGYSGNVKYGEKGVGVIKSEAGSPLRVMRDTPITKNIKNADYLLERDSYDVAMKLRVIWGDKTPKQVKMIGDYTDGVLPKNQFPKELAQSAKDLRAVLDSIAIAHGLKPGGRVKTYMPHIVDDLLNAKEKLPVELVPFLPKNVRSRFEMHRTGSKGYSTDWPKVMEIYSRSMLRSNHYNKVVKDISAHYNYLPPTTKAYVKWYVTSDIKNMPSVQEAQINETLREAARSIPIVGDKLSAQLSSINPAAQGVRLFKQLVYVNALGVRPKQFLINLTQNTNYIAITPLKDVLTYGPRALAMYNTPAGKKAIQMSGVLGDTQTQFAGGGSPIMDTVMWNMRSSEAINRGIILLTEVQRQLAKGKTFDVALLKARDITFKVHFQYEHNIPKIFSSTPLGKAMSIFTTYPIKQTEFLMDQNIGNFVKYAAITAGIVYAAEEAGVDVSREIGGGLFGEEYKYAPMGMLPTSIPIQNTMSTLADLIIQAVDGDPVAKRAIDMRNPKNWRNVPVIPGGRFMSDIASTKELIETGKMRSKSGKVTYETDDPVEIALTALGFRSTNKAKVDSVYNSIAERKKKTDYMVNDVALSFIDKNMKDAKAKFDKYQKLGLTAKQVANRIKSLETDRIQTAFKGLNKLDKIKLIMYLHKKGKLNETL